MEEKRLKEKRTQWHPGFFAGIQIELEQDAENLIFENEHQLGTKPMEIDVLIIKKNQEIPVSKNIGRIFRKYNIVEYKSPEDYLSIDDYYKVYGYSCFYKADTKTVNAIDIKDITISFICSKYPQKLVRHLKEERKYEIVNVEKGIYHVIGDVIPIQIIITNRLSHKENIWLKSLSEKVKEAAIAETLIKLYEHNKKNPLYSSVMDLIVRMNKNKFEEVRDMCEALEELMKDKIEEKAEERAKIIAEEKAQIIAEEKAQIIAEEKAQIIAEEKAQIIAEEKLKTIMSEILDDKIEMAQNRINELNCALIKANRVDDVIKAAMDKEYQKKLFEEFDL